MLQQSNIVQAKILIVDDDPQMLDILRTILEPWGFTLTLLDDPQRFWTVLEQANPDLLILDIEMPHLSGIDLCQVVRNDPHWSELPVLFLSAHRDIETVTRVFAVGADDYVNKPVLAPELIARVLNRLERTYPSFITLGRRRYELEVELMHDGTRKLIHLTNESLKSKLQ